MEIIEPYLLVTGHAHCYLPSFSLKGRRATNMYLLFRITSSDVQVLPFFAQYMGRKTENNFLGQRTYFLTHLNIAVILSSCSHLKISINQKREEELDHHPLLHST